MAALPTGTVTFLFTDIEGSTRVLQDEGDARYAEALADHRRILSEAFHSHQGQIVDRQGDAFLVAFPRARDAVRSAVAAQIALAAHKWPDDIALRVRMGLHTGEPELTPDGYVGVDLHKAARICAAAHGGQILVSGTSRSLAGDDPSGRIGFQDLGEHRLKDLTLSHRLYQVTVADLPSDFPPPRSLNVQPNNLPIQLTSFVGREHEIAESIRLLSTSRLLTLTGPGGAGKTRLALQVAADILGGYTDGVWLVELATLFDTAFVPQRVATALSVREQPGRPPMETLADSLRAKNMLLILDNCEHLMDACVAVADELLRACPGLRILATSREALQIPGEVNYAVPPLSLPDSRSPSVPDIRRSEAARLFVERAALARRGFTLQENEAATLVQICRRLDGNPLAIELAAARIRVLSMEELLSRLDDLFRLLTDGGRTTLPRHQTLEATIDWSYKLLTEPEKILFRRLSIFTGGWTLAAAENVCAGDGIEPADLLDLQTRLIEKSLVAVESQADESRYRMLDTIREYGRAKLADSGEAGRIQLRHLGWFLSLAERAKPELRGPHQTEWLDRLEADHDNLRAALKTSLAEAEAGLRLGTALARFWYRHGHLLEGRMWLESLIAHGGSAPPSVRAEALYAAARLATRLSDYSTARTFDEESLMIFRATGDKRGTAESLHALARLPAVRGDYAGARPLYEESLTIFRMLGDRRGIAVVSIDLGWLMHMLGKVTLSQPLLEESLSISRELGERLLIGAALHALGWSRKDRADYVVAQSLLEESVEIFTQLGDDWYRAVSLSGLGGVAIRRGRYDEARRLYEESLSVLREVGGENKIAESLQGLADVMYVVGDLAESRRYYEKSLTVYGSLNHHWGSAEALAGLGWTALRRGDYAEAHSLVEQSRRMSEEEGNKRSETSARCALGKVALLAGDYDGAARCYREALELAHGLEEKPWVAACLEGLAAVALGRGHMDRAARLCGGAGGIRETIGAPLPPVDRDEYERCVSAMREAAGEARFGQAWSEGKAMTLDRAVAFAFSEESAAALKGGAKTISA